MQHLTEEQLVLHHYHDGDAPAAAEAHLAQCAECREQLDAIRAVLAVATDAPLPERGEAYGEEVWTRLRWKLGSRTRGTRAWRLPLAAAATIAIAFLAGVLWHERRAVKPQPINVVQQQPATRADGGKLLLVVVGDHLDNSERMLTQLANADASQSLDVTAERRRAEELVASNRIYRQAAAQRGDERLEALLSDLEPVLTDVAHADNTLSPAELASLQKRIESKGLLFKVRVANARGNQSL